MTLTELKTAYFDWMKSAESGQNYSKNTLRSYQRAIDGFCDQMTELGVIDVRKLTSAWIGVFFKELANNGLSLTSQVHYRSVLASFLDYAYYENLIDENPVKVYLQQQQRGHRKSVRKPQRLPPVLLKHEQDALFDAVFASNHANRIRDLALVGLLLDTGLRTEELCQFTLTQAQNLLQTGKVRVIGKGDKERLIQPLGIHRQALLDWINERETRGISNPELFITIHRTPLKQPVVYQLINRYLQKAAIEKPQMGGHLLRHTAASMMLNEGMTIRRVQENLGHSNITTTERYLHLI
ncbi:MAG: tyrosine-type recombinase/integrase [Gammaproteobacteria bacterium]|nr:tyrosine-type recombinase/integrase [Gammaproteobacteria bacterium]